MTNNYLGKDIKLNGSDVVFSKSQDFDTISDEANLAQAISNRLSTAKGEYKLDSAYGSELSKDIGLPSTEFVINAIQGHIAETLQKEVRVKSFNIVDISKIGNTVNVLLSITPITTNKSFNMVYPYYLEV